MAKPIMIQGTMSNAGKSILAGGLCRVFAQDGYKVAPFKSQNMALNSYITEEGLEMGRAQVMQAEAAGIKPSVLMNPILLKPSSDTGSQVIINGEVMGNMSAIEYYRHKKEYVPAIMQAYEQLNKEYDIIVIEGAGSPAEINLKQEDIVNMGMAKLADAPVILVGDIDRGGVFAQIVGTIELLEKEEQERIVGTVINKFRGDKKILDPGLKMLEDRTNKPVLGVIPYFHLDIDEEDSLSERIQNKKEVSLIDIAVIRFPRLSNFTDMMALECMDMVSVRYVNSAAEFGNPDAVILPGSKNTMEDILWMRQNGLEMKIQKHAKHDKLVFGICGGYQMLGEEIEDPNGVEKAGKLRGLGLLPTKTVFQKEKKRTRVKGTFQEVPGMLSELKGIEIEGYEIHMGKTSYLNDTHGILKLNDIVQNTLTIDGAAKGTVYGSYVHGIFDKPEVARQLIIALLKQKGLNINEVEAVDMSAYKEEQYDKLAAIIRENLDMSAIYKILIQVERP